MATLKKIDLIKGFSLIRITYPNAYPTKTDEEEQMLIEAWYDIFSEYPREVFFTALKTAMKTSEFAPKPATIMREIEKMRGAYEKDDAELWGELQDVLREVSRCVSMFHYTYKDGDDGLTQGERAWLRVDKIFDSLDPALKEYCRNKRGLIELAQYTGEQTSYERGRFMRIMPTIRERIKTRHEMPENVRQLLQSMVDKMQIKTIDGEPLKLDYKGDTKL